MKAVLGIVLTIGLCSVSYAKKPSGKVLQREPASVGEGFISVGSTACSTEEDQKMGATCTRYIFRDALSGQEFKAIAGSDNEMPLRYHVTAILMGVGSSGAEYQEIRSIIESAKTLREVDEALSKFEGLACDRGAYTIVYKRYVDILEKRLKCSARR